MAANKLKGTRRGKSRSARFYQDNPEAKEKKDAYNKKFHSTAARRKYRAKLNKKNRELGSKVGDGLDVAHKGGKIVGLKSQSANRGSKTDSPGDRRARG